MHDVKVLNLVTNKKDGKKCEPGNFFTINYEGYMAEDDMDVVEVQVFNNKAIGDSKPRRFHQGFFEVVKCWDMSVHLLSVGQTIELWCPFAYANGGAQVYGDFGNQQVPAKSNIRYKLEVLECEDDVKSFNKANQKYKFK